MTFISPSIHNRLYTFSDQTWSMDWTEKSNHVALPFFEYGGDEIAEGTLVKTTTKNSIFFLIPIFQNNVAILFECVDSDRWDLGKNPGTTAYWPGERIGHFGPVIIQV